MKILAFDPASVIGWSLLDGEELIEYGTIKCDTTLTIQQKLNYYHLEVTRLIDRLKPDECVIEDLIMGISGVKTLVYLSRISGAVILSCVKKVRPEKITFYKPSDWKASCGLPIKGSAKKWQIQLEVCKKFGLIHIQDDFFTSWNNKIIKFNYDVKKLEISKIENDKSISTMKRSLGRKKRNVLTDIERHHVEVNLKKLVRLSKELSNEKKELKKSFDKMLIKLSKDIYYKTCISSDIADSIGIALCHQRRGC